MNSPDTHNLKEFRFPVREELDYLEKLFESSLHSEIPFIAEICDYIKEAPGKRLRPTILFLAARSTGETD
ncbi:MAG: hypothetical protein KAX38_00040, partial [Candidatus Krumholzibacteria bacterium]|nr:hypothetical protein [Candidatus Krumholzibacteria bacterium]